MGKAVVSCMLICALCAGLPAAAEEIDTGMFGRVSEEVFVITHIAKPGEVIVVVERLADPVDHQRYYRYAGLSEGAILLDVIEQTVTEDGQRNRVGGVTHLALAMGPAKEAYLDGMDYFGKEFKMLLTVLGSGGRLRVQSMRERHVTTVDYTEE